MKAIINLRLALIALKTEISENAIAWHKLQLKKLAHRESQLRTQRYRARQNKNTAIFPQ